MGLPFFGLLGRVEASSGLTMLVASLGADFGETRLQVRGPVSPKPEPLAHPLHKGFQSD